MLNTIFDTVFTSSTVTVGSFIACMVTALILGLVLALVHMYKTRYTKSFVLTLAILPMVVTVVIMMVNGNIGAGVAVAGAFSLVRFRSVPGTAKEIGILFSAMGTGLICGMGYLAYAVLFTVIVGAVILLLQATSFGETKKHLLDKTVRITIPEDLDYTDVFKDIMNDYTTRADLVSVKTTNMGSMFKLTYDVTLKTVESEKEFIDKLRCRNGNLEISVSTQSTAAPAEL